jgi:hypothetical protein
MASLRRLVSGISAAACALALACTSPTLPLPPPASPTISAGSTPDTIHLTSAAGAEPNALVVIVNRNTDLPRNQRVTGTISDEQGTWDGEVIAHPNDTLDISQEVGAVRSPSTTIVVK